MTTYWRPNLKTGEVVFCDEHGCVLRNVPDGHSVAIRDSVGESECFNMVKILTDLLPDSHGIARENVPVCEVVWDELTS